MKPRCRKGEGKFAALPQRSVSIRCTNGKAYRSRLCTRAAKPHSRSSLELGAYSNATTHRPYPGTAIRIQIRFSGGFSLIPDRERSSTGRERTQNPKRFDRKEKASGYKQLRFDCVSLGTRYYHVAPVSHYIALLILE